MSTRIITLVNEVNYEDEISRATAPLSLSSPAVTLQDGNVAKLDPSTTNSSALALLLSYVKTHKIPIFLELNDQRFILRATIPISDQITGLQKLSNGTLEVQLKHLASFHYLRPTHDSYKQIEALLLSALAGSEEVVIAANEFGDIIHVEREIRPFDPKPLVDGASKSELRRATPDQLFATVSTVSCDPLALDQTCIPFKYPKDGCWARAHEMYRLLNGQATIGKIWLYGSLRVATANDPTCSVGWRYHVAPTVDAANGSTLVLDPSLFDRPVAENVWVAKQTIGGTSVKTAGSVYYRAADGTTEDDPGFMKTAGMLRRYRGKLQEMTLNSGPPPYAHCGPIA